MTSALKAIESQVVLTAKAVYGQLSVATTDQQRLARAALIAQRADAATSAGQYDRAMSLWIDAVRVLAPGRSGRTRDGDTGRES